MSAPVQCWVDVEAAGIVTGAGPLTHIVSWRSTPRLSAAGTFSLTVAAADPNASALALKRVVRCWTFLDGVRTEIGAGVIDSIKRDGNLHLVVEGNDLLAELGYRSVHELQLYDETTHAPTKVLYYNGSYTALDDLRDNDLSSSDPFNLAGSNEFLFVGYSTPYNVLYAFQTSQDYNTAVAGLHYGYSLAGLGATDAWPELKIYSDTQLDANGIPWPAALRNNLPAPFVQVTETTPGGGGTDEIQTITLYGTPVRGTFTLTFGANTTAALAYNGTAAAMQTALRALASIGGANVTVAGANGGPYTVTFIGALANTNVALMTATSSMIGGDTTGTVLFHRNGNWGSATVDGTAAYWLRIDPDADLAIVDADTSGDYKLIDEFLIGIRTNRLDDLQPILDLAPAGWSLAHDDATTFDRTATGTIAVFAGESVLAALVKLAKNHGESFRLGTGRTIEWLHTTGDAASFPSSGVRAVQGTGSDRLAANLAVCQIVSLEKVQDTTEVITRVYPYGPGTGAARVDLTYATLDADPSWPAGYTMEQADNYIKYTVASPAAGEALYGQIDRVVAFKDITATDDVTAANNLAQAALSYLQKRSAAKTYYRLTVTGIHAILEVGTTIRVVYREGRDGIVTLAIDEDLIILSATHTFAAGQVYTTVLEVGTADAWPATDAEVLADLLEEATFYESYPQPVAAAQIDGIVTAASLTNSLVESGADYLLATGARTGATAAAQTFTTGVIDSSLTAARLLASSGAKQLASVADLAAWVAGTTNQITVTNDLDGSITLSLPQSIHTAATPTFGGLVAAYLRPASDSTTALQLQNAAGTNILDVDTTNSRIGIGSTAPGAKLEVLGGESGASIITLKRTTAGQANTWNTRISSIFTTVVGTLFINPSTAVADLALSGTSGDTPQLILQGSSGSVGIGMVAFGTSAAKVIGIANGTAPSSSPADATQLYSLDYAAGDAGLHIRSETGAIHKFASVADLPALIVNESGAAAGDLRAESDTEANMILLDASADLLYLGGSTNGVQIAKGGDITLTGTAKYERHIQIPAMTTGAVANQPNDVDFFTAGGLQFVTTGAKYAFCQWELPDDWDGGDIYFEVDWFPDSGATSGTDAVRWTVEYRAIAEGELINNGTSVTLDNGAGGDTADYAQYTTKHTRMTMAYNNANQPLTVQDHIYFKVSRDTGVANDFGGSVTVTAYEIIYTSKGFPAN